MNTFRRRKPQNLTPPLSSDSAQSLSPRASPSAGGGGGGGAGAGAGKRAGGGPAAAPLAGEDAPAAKKQRISHYVRRPSPPSSGYATTSSGERHASDNEDDRTTGNFSYTYFTLISHLSHTYLTLIPQLIPHPVTLELQHIPWSRLFNSKYQKTILPSLAPYDSYTSSNPFAC